MVIPKSICHLRQCKMDESQVNCWLKQMVKIRKAEGAGVFRGGRQQGSTVGNQK